MDEHSVWWFLFVVIPTNPVVIGIVVLIGLVAMMAGHFDTEGAGFWVGIGCFIAAAACTAGAYALYKRKKAALVNST